MTSARKFCFVGERPSPPAVAIGATWQNGKLAGATLQAALVAYGLDPAAQHYINLYHQPTPQLADLADECAALGVIRRLAHDGYHIVGMGRIVCHQLTKAGVPHSEMVHPAARGRIRHKTRYQAHVAAVLVSASDDADERVAA